MSKEEDPELDRIMNDFLIGFFVPASLFFVALWAAFRLVFDELLLSYGLVRIAPQTGYGALAGGWGRFLLLVVITAGLMVPYVVLYFRFLRRPLTQRGLVR